MSDVKQFDIPHMAHILSMRKKAQRGTTLVLGSRTGGLFRSQAFYNRLLPFSLRDSGEMNDFEKFAECYRLLTRNNPKKLPNFSARDVDMILTAAIREVEITDADICLAELAKQELFKVIITTNMDNLLEDSFEYIGMKELQDFEVFSMREGAGEKQFQLEKKLDCQIFKVFGQIKTREYKVMRGGYLGQNQEIRDFLADKLSEDPIVIGLDPVWDAELYHAFPLQGDSFWYVNEEALDEGSPLFQVGAVRSSRSFVREEGRYQYFIQELHESFLKNISAVPLLDYHMNGSILRELHKFRNEFRSEIENAHRFRKEVKSELQKLRDGF